MDTHFTQTSLRKNNTVWDYDYLWIFQKFKMNLRIINLSKTKNIEKYGSYETCEYICLVGITEDERRRNGAEATFKWLIAKKFPNAKKDIM